MAKTIIQFEVDSGDLEHWDDQYLALALSGYGAI